MSSINGNLIVERSETRMSTWKINLSQVNWVFKQIVSYVSRYDDVFMFDTMCDISVNLVPVSTKFHLFSRRLLLLVCTIYHIWRTIFIEKLKRLTVSIVIRCWKISRNPLYPDAIQSQNSWETHFVSHSFNFASFLCLYRIPGGRCAVDFSN